MEDEKVDGRLVDTLDKAAEQWGAYGVIKRMADQFPQAYDHLVKMKAGEHLSRVSPQEVPMHSADVYYDGEGPASDIEDTYWNSRLRSDIKRSINRNSAENKSNTPDFILAEFLTDCLRAFDEATNQRTMRLEQDRESTEVSDDAVDAARNISSYQFPDAEVSDHHPQYFYAPSDLPQAEYILRIIMPQWWDMFLTKNRKYKDVDQTLGAKGVFPDINRKVGVLKSRLWDDAPETDENTRQVAGDLIGHLFLLLYLIESGIDADRMRHED